MQLVQSQWKRPKKTLPNKLPLTEAHPIYPFCPFSSSSLHCYRKTLSQQTTGVEKSFHWGHFHTQCKWLSCCFSNPFRFELLFLFNYTSIRYHLQVPWVRVDEIANTICLQLPRAPSAKRIGFTKRSRSLSWQHDRVLLARDDNERQRLQQHSFTKVCSFNGEIFETVSEHKEKRMEIW